MYHRRFLIAQTFHKEVSKLMKKTRGANGKGTVYRRSDGRYCAQMTIKNSNLLPYHGKKLTTYGRTQKEAWEKMLKKKKDWEEKNMHQASNTRLKDWLDEWMNKYQKLALRNKTWESYRWYINRHILPELGNKKLCEITPIMIQRLYASKLQPEKTEAISPRPLSNSSIKYIHSILSNSFKQAYELELIKASPMDKIRPPKLSRKEREMPEEEQFDALLAALKNERYYIVYLLAFGSGMRRGEIAGLKWNDIDFKKKTITVQRSIVTVGGGIEIVGPKTEQSKRTIFAPDEIIHKLSMWKEQQGKEKEFFGKSYDNDGFIFCWEDGSLVRPDYYTRRLRIILARIKIKQMRFHDIRHLHATHLLHAGADLKTIQYRLGHSTPTMTMNIYSHYVPRVDAGAVKIINDKLEKLNKEQDSLS